MYPQTHMGLGIIFIAILALTGHFPPLALFVIYASSILIDVDHWFIYVIKKKDLHIMRSYRWFDSLRHTNPRPRFFCIFHTIEFFILMIYLSTLHYIFYWILIGISFHFLIDFIDFLIKREYGRYSSVIYFLIKNSQ